MNIARRRKRRLWKLAGRALDRAPLAARQRSSSPSGTRRPATRTTTAGSSPTRPPTRWKVDTITGPARRTSPTTRGTRTATLASQTLPANGDGITRHDDIQQLRRERSRDAGHGRRGRDRESGLRAANGNLLLEQDPNHGSVHRWDARRVPAGVRLRRATGRLAALVGAEVDGVRAGHPRLGGNGVRRERQRLLSIAPRLRDAGTAGTARSRRRPTTPWTGRRSSPGQEPRPKAAPSRRRRSTTPRAARPGSRSRRASTRRPLDDYVTETATTCSTASWTVTAYATESGSDARDELLLRRRGRPALGDRAEGRASFSAARTPPPTLRLHLGVAHDEVRVRRRASPGSSDRRAPGSHDDRPTTRTARSPRRRTRRARRRRP